METSKGRNTCAHFAPHGSGILQAGYAMMDAYKDKCWWCEIERLTAAVAACQTYDYRTLADEIERLRVALMKATHVIEGWHNLGIPEGQQADLWNIYWRKSPEMKPIREALSSGHETPVKLGSED